MFTLYIRRLAVRARGRAAIVPNSQKQLGIPAQQRNVLSLICVVRDKNMTK